MSSKGKKALTKKEIYKRVKEILAKDKNFKDVKIKIDFRSRLF